MSRKNRNGQRQAKRPLNLKGIQMSMTMPTDAQARTAPAAPKPGFVQSASEVKMLDAKCSYQFTRLPSTILESDTSYQRPIDMKRVQRIVDNFDRRLVNPLKVSLRDGHYYVFDGAHTLSVLKEVNKFDNFMVDCMLMNGIPSLAKSKPLWNGRPGRQWKPSLRNTRNWRRNTVGQRRGSRRWMSSGGTESTA